MRVASTVPVCVYSCSASRAIIETELMGEGVQVSCCSLSNDPNYCFCFVWSDI